MARLAGSVAIVTGGAKGIGRHYALALADEGARVMIGDIAPGDDVVAEIGARHGANAAAAMTLDVSSEADVSRFVARTMELFGRIDVLVNNAALSTALGYSPITEIDQALWDRVMAVNVRGPFLMAKHVIPHMRAGKRGKIINIGSGTAAKGAPNMLHYITSKGAIAAMTRAMAREFGDDNICVNTLAPGLVLSDSMIESGKLIESQTEAIVRSRAIRRDSFPADLTGALVFLASRDSDFVTGQTLAVDGGSTNN